MNNRKKPLPRYLGKRKVSFLKPIIDIGGHMIRASVFEVIGDLESANEERSEARLIAEADGYHHVFNRNKNKRPSYLVTYPELRLSWELGHEQGVVSWEIKHCISCQNPDVKICLTHLEVGVLSKYF